MIVMNDENLSANLGCRSTASAFLFARMTTKVALGAVVTHAPAITDLDQDPFDIIETGDWVKVDADHGIVEVIKKK
jgi:hypothetical protein